MSNKSMTIWFDDKGNMLPSTRSWIISRGNGKSEECKDFDDSLEYVTMYDGKQAAGRVHLRSTKTGREYSMYVYSFDKVIKARRFVDNIIEGTFRFMKSGVSQSIILVLPEPSAP